MSESGLAPPTSPGCLLVPAPGKHNIAVRRPVAAALRSIQFPTREKGMQVRSIRLHFP